MHRISRADINSLESVRTLDFKKVEVILEERKNMSYFCSKKTFPPQFITFILGTLSLWGENMYIPHS